MMINSRSLVRIQWFAIIALVLAYWLKPVGPCPDVMIPTRTVYVAYHDSTPKKDTVPVRTTGRYKKILVAPSANLAKVDTPPLSLADSFCTEYVASTSDSSVDIEVKWCATAPSDSMEITYKLKGVRMVTVIDSIPYPVGVRRGVYMGATVTTGEGFGPRIDLIDSKKSISYTYDAVQNQHILGASFRIFGW